MRRAVALNAIQVLIFVQGAVTFPLWAEDVLMP